MGEESRAALARAARLRSVRPGPLTLPYAPRLLDMHVHLVVLRQVRLVRERVRVDLLRPAAHAHVRDERDERRRARAALPVAAGGRRERVCRCQTASRREPTVSA